MTAITARLDASPDRRGKAAARAGVHERPGGRLAPICNDTNKFGASWPVSCAPGWPATSAWGTLRL